jgi:hypothetical protein
MAIGTPAIPDVKIDHIRPMAVVLGVLRMLLSVVALLAIYFWVPVTGDSNVDVSAVLFTVGGMTLFVVVFVVQIRRIGRTDYPILVAGETFVSVLLLFLFIFALAYDALSLHDASYFSQSLSRLDSLYFTITVFTTVGFGDITATNEVTRSIVSVQMLLDLVFLAFLVRIVTTAAQATVASRRSSVQEPVAADERDDVGDGDRVEPSAPGRAGASDGP